MHSKFVLSQTDPRPLYLQLIEQIKTRIALGDWKAGDEIPSIRALAVSAHVSIITVKRAYTELENEGIIVTRQGKGSFISNKDDLGSSLYAEEMEMHITRVAELAEMLGLGPDEIARRLQAASAKIRNDAS